MWIVLKSDRKSLLSHCSECFGKKIIPLLHFLLKKATKGTRLNNTHIQHSYDLTDLHYFNLRAATVFTYMSLL